MSSHELLANSPPLSQIDATRRQMHTPPSLVRQSPTRLEQQQVLRREACATAVAHDRERIAEGLYDSVIHRLFAAGLQLQATCQVVDEPTQTRIETTIDLLDSTITELRKAIFSLH
ncbi:MAG: histidine kinase [Ilumatobacteraceae bacterium]